LLSCYAAACAPRVSKLHAQKKNSRGELSRQRAIDPVGNRGDKSEMRMEGVEASPC
jgi:hypothetical protein